nr:hypothetical protein [Tanacetum cinerariifolium]
MTPFIVQRVLAHDVTLYMQTSGSGNTFLLAVAFFFRQWEVTSGSGNFLTSSGNALCILFPTVANLSNQTVEPSRHLNFIYDDDDDYEESTIILNEIDSQIHAPIVITTSPPILRIEDPEDSLIMGNEELSIILEKESDEIINPSVEDFVPIPSESEDISGSDSECDFPSCDDFSPINIPEGKSVTFSNPFFDSNDDFTSSDDESLSDEDVSEDNVKIYGVNILIDHRCCYKCGNSLNDFFCPHCTCEFCRNGAHVGYNCPAHVPSFQTLPSFPQQHPCCEDYGGLPKADHCQPPQYTVNHPIFNAYNDLLNSQTKLIEQVTSMCETFGQFIQKKHKEEQAANARYWKIPAYCDDDDDYNFAITPNEPVDSLSMGDEHLNTIPAMESDEFIKSSVENLVPNLNESEGENGCDVPACFTTFSNVLFNADYEFDSSDDQSLYDEEVPEKIFSNPLFEEEIIPIKIDQHHDNAESTLDSSLIISSKIDSLLYEFADELTLLKSISPGIDETDCDLEEDIRLTERLLYDNSSPRPPEEFVSENYNADIESFSPSPIPVEDSDSFMEEIDLSFNPDAQCRLALRKMIMTLKGIF